MRVLQQVGPSTWRFVDDSPPPTRSNLPCPYIISDAMPLTEQVNGQWYDSKSQFRAVGKQLGLVEVGNEKLQPRVRSTDRQTTRHGRRRVIKDAIDKVRAGHYERVFHPDGTSRARERAAADRGDDT